MYFTVELNKLYKQVQAIYIDGGRLNTKIVDIFGDTAPVRSVSSVLFCFFLFLTVFNITNLVNSMFISRISARRTLPFTSNKVCFIN